MSECFIYGIYDRRDGQGSDVLPHYVGLALVSIEDRRRAHLRDRDNESITAPRAVWMRSVPEDDLMFVELARAPIEEIGELEIEMIARYKKLRSERGLSRLTNRHPGGLGGPVFGTLGATDEDRSEFAYAVWESRRRNGTAGMPFSDEERMKRAQRARDQLNQWNARVASGEVASGTQGKKFPGTGRQSWEARRAMGYRSQKEILADIAKAHGYSPIKLGHALKGRCDRVAPKSCDHAWRIYDQLNEIDKMQITVVPPAHGPGNHPPRVYKPRGPLSAEGRAKIAKARSEAWARMTDEERSAMGAKQEESRRRNRLTRQQQADTVLPTTYDDETGEQHG